MHLLYNCLIRVSQHTGRDQCLTWVDVIHKRSHQNLCTFEGIDVLVLNKHIKFELASSKNIKVSTEVHLLKAQYICTCAKCKIKVHWSLKYLRICTRYKVYSTHFMSRGFVFHEHKGFYLFICMEWSQFCWKRELGFLLKNKN